ncbi:hypothetical protein [Mesorhizobium sp. M0006]|uniref:hypothetical protein n=1 Tax=Mesorhizobium sp. M0006 TaxID=2956838 RepID=UPI00333D6814
MPEIIVQIVPEDQLQNRAVQEGPFATAKNLGHTLEQIHPGSADPDLARWYRAEVDNDQVADLLKALRNNPGVSAAYVKPQAEAP